MHKISFRPPISQECDYYNKQDIDAKLANVTKLFDDFAKAAKIQATTCLPDETRTWIERVHNDQTRKQSDLLDLVNQLQAKHEALQKEHDELKAEHLDFVNHMIDFKMVIAEILKIEFHEEDNEQPSQKLKLEEETIVKTPATPVRNHLKAPQAEEHPIGSIARMMSMGLVSKK